jgi:hypothetical protein
MEKDYITTEFIILMLILFGAGIFSVYFGVTGLKGHRRRSYIFPLDYGYVAGLGNYGSIPLGIMAISWPFILVFLGDSETWGLTCACISGLVGFAGVLLGVLQPKFMEPQWYRWLMENHEDIWYLLQKDVRQMGLDVWQRRTTTQEGLEVWVAEVRRKNGLPEKPTPAEP